PHPGAAVDSDRVQAQVGAHSDQRFFKAPNVIDDIERFSQSDDRIADQLPWTMPGDLAAAVGVDDGSAINWSLVRLSAPSRGVDGRVLQKQQRIGAAGHSGVGQVALQLPGSEVVDRPQLADGDRGRYRPDGTNHAGEATPAGTVQRCGATLA